MLIMPLFIASVLPSGALNFLELPLHRSPSVSRVPFQRETNTVLVLTSECLLMLKSLMSLIRIFWSSHSDEEELKQNTWYSEENNGVLL
jgi:hypothetical protein